MNQLEYEQPLNFESSSQASTIQEGNNRNGPIPGIGSATDRITARLAKLRSNGVPPPSAAYSQMQSGASNEVNMYRPPSAPSAISPREMNGSTTGAQNDVERGVGITPVSQSFTSFNSTLPTQEYNDSTNTPFLMSYENNTDEEYTMSNYAKTCAMIFALA
eukprot:CAMPEP_0194358090 /NCGR_PEP_ID=MMETSP0174-20130528/5430_1 /TAXON_ID=216777 /ORGANISM="Proboscia alata, Strain PI-D3" /LENGTH=160 /DNA_ID=CAMNT_0039128325 /DNA_START=114 /DNA_END=597 /DNA_ORIENTATION=+